MREFVNLKTVALQFAGIPALAVEPKAFSRRLQDPKPVTAGARLKCVLILILILSSTLTACSTAGYYWQSAAGHMRLMWQRVGIEELLQDPNLPQMQRKKLTLVLEARKFASSDLGLPDNGSYTHYVDTGQHYVVWNVFATPEFSLELNRWCFLIVGCVGYRGYYAESEAQELAKELAAQGYDTDVSGAIAYSTLGWFDDPVLNTFINYPDPNLVGLIFHELAHQQIYIQHDTAFNEGFASMIEIEGVRRWLQAHPESGDIEHYYRHKQLRSHFVALVSSANGALRELYASALTPSEKRQGKQAIIAKLRQDYATQKTQVEGFKIYDSWFSQAINNARLASVAAYADRVPAFAQLLLESGDDLAKFYPAVKRLAALEPQQREQAFAQLLERAR